MNILIIRSFPSLIDLKTSNYNHQEIGLAKAILSLGHQVGIVYFGGEIHKNDMYCSDYGNINIYYRKAQVFVKKIAFYESFDDLKTFYDLLILNEYDQLETFRTLKKYSSKVIIYHGPYYASFNKKYNIYNKLYDFLFLQKIKKISPLIFTKSKLAKEYLEQKGLFVKDYLGVGLDESQLTVSGKLEKNNKKDQIRLLYIGKIEPRRNLDFLVQVFAQLNQYEHKYHMTIIGTGSLVEIEKLQKAIKITNMTNDVTYIEKMTQAELPAVYSNSDLFLLPTSYEIWGMVLMEAMWFDLPVITTYNGGSSSLVEENVNGKVLELNIEKWVSTIRNVCFDKTALHKCNQRLLYEKCNWTYIAKRLLEGVVSNDRSR